jgi:hypothetical protein
METETPPVCADCGLFLTAGLGLRSGYLARHICVDCYLAEIRRSTPENEVWVLKQLFRLSAP